MFTSLRNRFQRSATVERWARDYLQIVDQRGARKEIKQKTVDDHYRHVRYIVDRWGTRRMIDVTPHDVALWLREITDRGNGHTAKRLKLVLGMFYREAQLAGQVPLGYDPVAPVKMPRVKISRNRLSWSDFEKILAQAQVSEPEYMQRALLLAIVTGQRRADIVKMKHSDAFDDYLHIVQHKTGLRLALPLALRLDVLGMSIADVFERCRDKSGFDVLLHTTKNVHVSSVSTHFRHLRSYACGRWTEEGTPPSFHEIRSLSERLYRAQGIDTMTLLGHKSQRMTDKYHDLRGSEWRRLIL